MAKTKSKKEEIMVEENTVVEAPVEEGTDEDNALIFGVVAKCFQLNVRKKPVKNENNIVCVINAGDKVQIDEANSNKGWYKIITKDGKEGFCMKEFITVQ